MYVVCAVNMAFFKAMLIKMNLFILSRAFSFLAETDILLISEISTGYSSWCMVDYYFFLDELID